MMYDPNTFTLNLEQLLSSAPIGQSNVKELCWPSLRLTRYVL